MKPQRPAGSHIHNPRSHRLPGFELLNLPASSTAAKRAAALADVTNSARGAEKKSHFIEPIAKAPTSARDIAPTLDSVLARTPAASAAEKTTNAMAPETALDTYRKSLTTFEREEIMQYREIYFTGEGARKVSSRGANNGFDDDKGDYRVVMDDHIAYRYQVLCELGRGSFGQVLKAMDHKTKQFVAVKIIKNKKKFHDQALVEVNLLKHLRDRDPSDSKHIVRMHNSFIFRNHMIIIFELQGMNLYELCKANRFAPLSVNSIKVFARQLLSSLHYCYKERIVHCDLKPENILLKRESKSQIKLIDFGSSCFEHQKLYTYIQSRFYRAPEIILGIPYTTAIDMWSFGCILAELANGYPIFPGESEGEQLQCIMEFLGTPPRSVLEKAPRKRNFFDASGAPRLTPNSRGRVRRPSTKDVGSFLRSALKADDGALFVDFVQSCLSWDPSDRWTPAEAMRHPWIAKEFEHRDERRDSAAVSNATTPSVPQPPLTARKPTASKFTLPMLSARR